ncbi:hypothetical protein CC1G_09617 [Coprinopsis cinerea okayama7|uniref:DUF1996 domain-containing protein n=1 Tax=Coprinopsis cinerea (strain Okayama-7 / 130 / ATCC MYA-4618 / FGSC 9003) TaxID=240176 RepID=A8N4D3_COPC7|nr:hypothetical protein CC1G_09617 [Coprinopsis cinerea okayama7\|eukprot:XP_001829728.2 hypothetical protein CC1G_09617 [Coprinopsis cinerea okayama7\
MKWLASLAALVTERFDPLVTPGQVSPHVHQIVGGNAFNLTMDPSLDLPNLATCTTCKFKEDKSNYWTAVLYFKHPNGSFIRVPQIPNHVTGSPDGGMTVYYIQPPDLRPTVAFRPGFRMITGNPMLRKSEIGPKIDPESPQAWSSSFRCWDTPGFFDLSNSWAPGAGPYDTVELPNKPCPYGIRANIFFPSCWDGVNLDSPDHKSHVAWMDGKVNPDRGIFLHRGECPPSHPVRIPMLFYETVWDTAQFTHLWPEDGSQPFVLSMGDPTGYGHHGDYVFGWEGDSLQRAMDKCGASILGLPDSCPELVQISDEEMNSCKVPVMVDEVTEGEYLEKLPGCNPVQHGPDPATMVPHCDAVSTTSRPGATAVPKQG